MMDQAADKNIGTPETNLTLEVALHLGEIRTRPPPRPPPPSPRASPSAPPSSPASYFRRVVFSLRSQLNSRAAGPYGRNEIAYFPSRAATSTHTVSRRRRTQSTSWKRTSWNVFHCVPSFAVHPSS